MILLSHGFQSEYEAGIANGLARNGVNVVLVGSDSTHYDRLDPSIRVLNLRGSHDPRRSRFQKLYNLVRYFFAYQAFLARTKHDAVHLIGQFTTGNAFMSLLEGCMTRLLARRLVLTVHNVLPHERHTRLNKLFHKVLYSLPNTLVVHTERTKGRLEELFGIRPGKVLVMEHGIAQFPEFDSDARERLRADLGLADDHRLALFFGNLGWYKGPDLLIEAISRVAPLSNWHLLITGRCRHQDLKVAIQNLIDQSVARDRIHWHEGFVADADVPGIFFAADLLVLPYRHIDQSGVLFMAMATGLPVLASDVGSFKEYVGAHSGRVVPVENVDALESALLEIDVPLEIEVRQSLALLARRFDWSKTVEPLLAAYVFSPVVFRPQ